MPRQNKTIPHKPFVFINNCKQKRRLTNEREALKAADEQMLLKPDLELTAYKCDLCGGWHLTNKNKK
jgi:hypothetical protein